MGTAVSVGTRLGVTLTVVGGGRGVCVGADSAVGEGTPRLQAEVRSRSPIKKDFFMLLLISQEA